MADRSCYPGDCRLAESTRRVLFAPVADSHPRSLDAATGVFLALLLGWAALQIVVEVMAANVMELWQ